MNLAHAFILANIALALVFLLAIAFAWFPPQWQIFCLAFGVWITVFFTCLRFGKC